jgi:L-ascorbate metabolism protein UlaG (beta-lactamase superfamily)
VRTQIELLRHATLILHFGDRRFLVDPMLSPARAMDPVANAGNDDRIPLVDFPFSERELDEKLAAVEGVLVTHLHRDHWDAAARERLRKDLPIACQPGDVEVLRSQGFTAVTPIESRSEWRGLTVTRTNGEHGRGEIGVKMGTVSGFVVRSPGHPSIYVAGDTVWCPAVENALAAERPDVVVVNAGAAQFLSGGPITMDVDDVLAVARAAPMAHLIAVHFETVNHCRLTRVAMGAAVAAAGVGNRVRIPSDGEAMTV